MSCKDRLDGYVSETFHCKTEAPRLDDVPMPQIHLVMQNDVVHM